MENPHGHLPQRTQEYNWIVISRFWVHSKFPSWVKDNKEVIVSSVLRHVSFVYFLFCYVFFSFVSFYSISPVKSLKSNLSGHTENNVFSYWSFLLYRWKKHMVGFLTIQLQKIRSGCFWYYVSVYSILQSI